MAFDATAEARKAARRALASGRHDAAIALYRQTLTPHRNHADDWFNLGWAYRVTLRFDDAVDAYGTALQLGVGAPENALLNRAAILLEHLDRPAEALADLDRAVATRPDFVPAWLSLGVIAEDEGDLARARAIYARILVLVPGHGRASARLGALMVAEDDAAAAVRLLREALPAAASPADRGDMLFMLGNALDRLGAYDEAWAAYREANAAARVHAPVPYHARAHERLVDALIAAPPPPPLTKDTGGERQPIFVGGMFRSGSTLVERLLSRHPMVASGGERSFVPALVARWPNYPAGVADTDDARLTEWRTAYRAALPPAPFVIDKRCDNILHLGLVARLFPASRFVHTHRHPLDTILSIYSLDFGGAVTYGTDLAEAAHYFGQYARLMRHWRAVAADRLVDLDYDQLVRTPEPVLAATLAALDLPAAAGLSVAADSAAPVRTASAWQVRRPVNDRSSGRWHHYDRHLGEAKRILRDAGIDCG